MLPITIGKHKAKLLSIFFVSLLALLPACVDKDFDLSNIDSSMEFNPNMAITIGSTTITIDSLFNKFDSLGNIQQDQSGMFYLVYEQQLGSYRGEDKLPIPSGQLDKSFDLALLPTDKFNASGVASNSTPDNFKIVFQTEQVIDSFIVKSGTINLTAINNYPYNGQLIVQLPDAVKDGKIFSDTFGLVANNTTPIFHPRSLQGYKLKFSNPTTNESSLAIRMILILNNGPANGNVGLGSVNLTESLSDLHYSTMYGYIGKDTLVNSNSSFDLSFLNRDMANNIEFKDPKLELFIKNSYGAPLEFNFNNMQVVSQNDPTPENVTFTPASESKKTINQPPTERDVTDTSIVFSNTNTNLFSLIQKSPKALNFNISALANANNNTKSNFMHDTSYVDASMRMTIPIYFKSMGFGTVDTFDFSPISGQDSNKVQIDELLFRVEVTNGMPVDFDLQLYFTDDNYTKLDSLFKSSNLRLVNAAKVGDNGEVTESTKSVSTIRCNREQLDALENTTKILAKINMQTASGNFVKFFNNYNMKFRFACQFKGRIYTND